MSGPVNLRNDCRHRIVECVSLFSGIALIYCRHRSVSLFSGIALINCRHRSVERGSAMDQRDATEKGQGESRVERREERDEGEKEEGEKRGREGGDSGGH